MIYSIFSLTAVTLFALVHLWAEKARKLDMISHGRLLSAGGGIAIAYVFVDLLPKLSQSDLIVTKALDGIFPYFEKHVYVLALLGFLLFFFINQSTSIWKKKTSFWCSLASYSLFNFLVGYAVVDKDNPEVQPLVLFTIAIGLHYFVNDYSLSESYGKMYRQTGKWILIASLYLGWLAGIWFILPEAGVALVSAFIGGGVIMNVTRHELPQENPHSLGAFLLATAFYTVILLSF